MAGSRRDVEQGPGNLRSILQTWKLKLSTTKKVSAVFHLNNKEATHEMKVNNIKETTQKTSI